LGFAADVYPILTARCIACHTPRGSGVTTGGLDLTTNLATGAYAQLLMRAMGIVPGTAGTTCAASALTRVVPGSAQISLLYNKVNSRLANMPALCGNPMPASGPPLTPAQVATIASWIDQGAKP
jgi:mono/diheme cytochrome c family protein